MNPEKISWMVFKSGLSHQEENDVRDFWRTLEMLCKSVKNKISPDNLCLVWF